VSSTPDLDVAKERLADSLSTAREATRTAVKDDIAPAVAAAVTAAREASAPIRAEAASRAIEAAAAIRGSDLSKKAARHGSDLSKKARKHAERLARRQQKPQRGKKIGIVAGVLAVGAGAWALIKRRSTPDAPLGAAYPGPPTEATRPTAAATPTAAPTTDAVPPPTEATSGEATKPRSPRTKSS
jgi:hypothetical protein